MILLDGRKVSQHIKNLLKLEFSKPCRRDVYIVIFLLNNHGPSIKYVDLKKKFGEDVGIKVKIINRNQVDINNIDKILEMIKSFNNDKKCRGIVFQLPLPSNLQKYQSLLFSSIKWYKDIDGLGGICFGLNLVGLFNFLPATSKAVVNILNYYNFNTFRGKKITVIGQSNLVGKPLVLFFMKEEAEVFSFNKFIERNILIDICKKSDIIISATGSPKLITSEFIKEDKSQILVDVGWEVIDGKPIGDVDFTSVYGKVKAITPVPGGVGPVTVACLFKNIIELDKIKDVYRY